MNVGIKILLYSLLGGLLAGVLRLITYLGYKTPEIGFDGPAAMSFILAIVAGSAVFGAFVLFKTRHE